MFLIRNFCIYKIHHVFLILFIGSSFFSHAQIPLIPYRSGVNWGFADTSGQVKITPFTPLMPHLFSSQGFARFPYPNGLFGLVNVYGKIIVPPVYREIEVFDQLGILARFTKVGHASGVKYSKKDSAHLYFLDGSKVLSSVIQGLYMPPRQYQYILVSNEETISLYQIQWKQKIVKLVNTYQNAFFESFVYENYESRTPVGFTISNTKQRTSSKYNFKGQLIVSKPKDIDKEDSPDSKLVSVIQSHEGPYLEAPSDPPVIVNKWKGQYTLSSLPPDSGSRLFDYIVPVPQKKSYLFCQLNKNWGIVNTSGQVEIEPIWDTIIPCIYLSSNFSMMKGVGNFLFQQWIVKKNGKYGIVSENSKFNIPVEYDSIIPENYFHYLVKKKQLWGAISDTGTEEIPCMVDMKFENRYYRPALAMSRNIILIGKTDDGFRLYSNSKLSETENYDFAKMNFDAGNGYIDLARGSLKGRVIESNGKYYIISCKYSSVYSHRSNIVLGDLKFTLVKLPNGQEGYVRQDGLEFFQP